MCGMIKYWVQCFDLLEKNIKKVPKFYFELLDTHKNSFCLGWKMEKYTNDRAHRVTNN